MSQITIVHHNLDNGHHYTEIPQEVKIPDVISKSISAIPASPAEEINIAPEEEKKRRGRPKKITESGTDPILETDITPEAEPAPIVESKAEETVTNVENS
jgi:hypothetical protein